ncbi:unnamed protein product [Arabidopsis thaliana]|uniref:(thale cress) hypothetical protein n=1 Tax=Arabidopsis thaliana TaxID=3702 RepID=A0A7G2EXN9_ARATH|nr:unnamed protein product [Arabidopsis thaliana]
MGKQKRRKGSLAPDPSPPRSVGSSSLASVSSVALPISQIQPSATLPDAQAAVPQTALAIPSPLVPRSGSDLETLPIIDVTSAVTPVPAGAPSAATPVPAVAPSVPCEVTPSRGPSPSPATAPATPVKELLNGFKSKAQLFTLPSGEACVKIPDSIIEKHKKSWESFILGQFYSDPPAQGTIHTIVNGIWSKQFRVSLSQEWRIDGQTMFVAKWEPGLTPVKPELTTAPIWLELRHVPFQFFNDNGLEHIASLVGEPKFLHPSTANKTNLEVARVFTIIDLRKPLPEALNVHFASGDIRRIEVSSPWMPPVCAHCKEVGHSLRKFVEEGDWNTVAPRNRRSTRSSVVLTIGPPLSVPDANAAAMAGSSKEAQRPNPITGKAAPFKGKGKTTAAKCEGQRPQITLIFMSIDIFCWNVCGFNSSSHRSGFKKWFRSRQPLLGSLLETHVRLPKQQKFLNALMPGWLFDNNYDFSVLGKIWLLWHPSVKVSILFKSLQMICCEVQMPNCSDTMVLSFVYASTDEVTRQILWNEIVDFSNDPCVIDKPWAVLGDFNQILHPSEHSTSDGFNVDRPTRIFRETILLASLTDLSFRGNTFTWWNKRSRAPVAKKLDRILVNDKWTTTFPSSLGLFGEPDFSDHSSCELSLMSASPRSKKPFRFNNFLLKDENFLSLICLKWFSTSVTGSAMYRVSVKLKALKKVIRDFSRDNYSDIEKRTKEAHDALLLAQSVLLASPCPSNAAIEAETQRKWRILAEAEASFFYQRSRVTWLREGDMNSSYFHKMASARQSLNHIHFLSDPVGDRIEGQQNLENHCVEYFQSNLGTSLARYSLFL